MKYPDNMDKECIKLCDAINRIEGLRTVESCCGHGKDNFRIWFIVKNQEHLPALLYYCDSCHVGFDWDCTVSTDCGMSPVIFRLQSRVMGIEAYEQSETIALEIENFLQNPEPDFA